MSILDEAAQHGLSDAVDPLRQLADAVPDEPEVREQLAQVYAKLGWHGEQAHTLADMAKRYKVPITMCGELAGKPVDALALMAIGTSASFVQEPGTESLARTEYEWPTAVWKWIFTAGEFSAMDSMRR